MDPVPDCEICQGEGQYPCPDCNGRGGRNVNRVRGGGSGNIYTGENIEWERCEICEGLGTRPCPVCGPDEL